MKTIFQHILLIVFCIPLSQTSVKAGNYSWTGATSIMWSTSTNWNPTGVPSTNDTVTITNQTNNPKLAANTTIKKFTMTSDTLDLNTYTLSVSDYSYMNGGTVSNGTFSSLTSTWTEFKGVIMSAKVKLKGGFLYFNGSVFTDSVNVTKTGHNNCVSKGGNYFFSTFLICR